MSPSSRPHVSMLTLALATVFASAAPAAELTGWALMPAKTFAPGPTSGQFATTAFPLENPLPLVDQQPVQGFSAVLNGPRPGVFYVMPDNGFGAKTNSADTLLRVYAVKPDFKTSRGAAIVGSGTVKPANFKTGAPLASFTEKSFINLRDPAQKLDFPIVADQAVYPNTTPGGVSSIPVDPAITKGRLLTGADFDIESVRIDDAGHWWFGDEFGPFLVETDKSGKVLRAEVSLPGVQSPQNPFLGQGLANLGRSSGFEGMAIDPKGETLFTLLEGTVTGDPLKSLRINQFDIANESYLDTQYFYQLDALGSNIGDMTAVNDHQYLVIERNGATGTSPQPPAPFKKIYLIDTSGLASGGFVTKTELVDLMNINDPNDLNGDGSTTFTFPFVTIEDVLILDEKTLLVINDNNYPGGGGRGNFADNTEFLKITLPEPLNLKKCRATTDH